MSIHPSLSISDKDKKQRSVLKRVERIKTLMEKGEWKKGNKIYGLPKIKTIKIKIKIKKEKVEKPAEAVVAEGAPSLAAETKEQAAAAPKAAAPKAATPKEKK